MNRPLTKLVVCPSPTALVAATAAIEQHKVKHPGPEKTILIIVVPSTASQNALSHKLTTIAQNIYPWSQIIQWSSEKLRKWEAELTVDDDFKKLVRDELNIAQLDQLYLVRNWRFVNTLLMNVYDEAKTVCYGDGIGFYFKPDYKDEQSGPFLKFKQKAASLFSRLTPPRIKLPMLPFDHGYFLVSGVFQSPPPMPFELVDRALITKILLDIPIPEEIQSHFEKSSPNRKAVFILTASLFEAGLLKKKSEVDAYCSFIKSCNLDRDSTIFIKPHPRESTHKISYLKKELEIHFDKVVVLEQASSICTPIESVFLNLQKQFGDQNLNTLKFISFGSTSIGLDYFSSPHCITGFGPELVKQFFPQNKRKWRLKFENDLNCFLNNTQTT